MRRHLFLLFCAFVTVAHLWSQAQNRPDLSGIVTRVSSGSDFDVNGIHLLCGPQTQYATVADLAAHRSFSGCLAQAPYLGQPMRINGSSQEHGHALSATWIEIDEAVAGEVKGVAVVDALPSPGGSTLRQGNLLLRADGYFIRVTPKTIVEWGAGLQTLAQVKAGDWIEFKGQQRQDGSIEAESAKFTLDTVTNFERRMRERTDYDLSGAKPSGKTRLSGEAAHPLPKRLHLYTNAPMQARIDRIGNSLIPAYQRNLLKTDPAKLNFRFVLVDQKKWHDAVAAPSGMIFIPYQLVERLTDDSELAAVLADNIACAMEKQTYLATKDALKVDAGEGAGLVAGAFIPGVGALSAIAGISGETKIQKLMEDQSGRVSLGLLHDAGYDITQAPKAWWLLAGKDREPLNEITLPERAKYLYRILGSVWSNPLAKPLIR